MNWINHRVDIVEGRDHLKLTSKWKPDDPKKEKDAGKMRSVTAGLGALAGDSSIGRR